MVSWSPDQEYYTVLVQHLLKGLRPFDVSGPVTEWHFSEFSSAMTFTLYSCCVEVMALPLPGEQVVKHLMETLYEK